MYTNLDVLKVCDRTRVSAVGQQRSWGKRRKCSRDFLELLVDACERHQVVDDNETGVGRSRLAQLAKELHAVFVGPVVDDVAEKEDSGVLDGLVGEEVVD